MNTRKICPVCGDEYGPDQEVCPRDGSPLQVDAHPDPLIGQIVADRYHVTGLLGEGGMGRVYVAEHVRMGRKSALKVMSPALAATADAITRFNREASNASRINHPNVAAIYDFGETADGLLYIAMEFVDGETLRALIERNGPLPIARATQIAKGAADALHAAHHLGIIHRDLKPDNIMLARQLDGTDWVKVVDFGIAKSVAAGERPGGQTVTTAGVSLGTPEYMSPEQLAGEKLDPRTDIYSLGLVLFNMLTGDLPYPRLTSKETLVRRLTSAPATLADVRPDVAWPPALQAVLSRALDPEPDRRYAGVEDFGRAVAAVGTAAAGGMPVGAEADLDRTVRLSPTARPAANEATAVRRSASGERPAGGAGQTRRLPPEKPRRTLSVPAVLMLLFLAAGGYAVAHGLRHATPGATAAVNADSLHDTTVSRTVAAADSSSLSPGATVDAPATPPAAAAHPATRREALIPPHNASTAATPARRLAPTPLPPPPQLDSTRAGSGPAFRRADVPSPAVGAPPTDSAASLVRAVQAAIGQIRNRFDQAGRLVADGRLRQANTAMQAARQEIRTLRGRLPPGRVPPQLQQDLRAVAVQAVRACYTEAQGDPQATQRCRQLQQREARAGRGLMPGRVRP